MDCKDGENGGRLRIMMKCIHKVVYIRFKHQCDGGLREGEHEKCFTTVYASYQANIRYTDY